jgi:predicted site-specific integrase-resolvase
MRIRLTIDQIADVFGVSRRTIIGWIGDGSLKWSLAGDKKTVMVELSAHKLKAAIKKQPDHAGAARPAASASPRERHAAFRGDHLTLSDLEAWAQRK